MLLLLLLMMMLLPPMYVTCVLVCSCPHVRRAHANGVTQQADELLGCKDRRSSAQYSNAANNLRK